MKRLLLRGYGEIPIKINPIGEQDGKHHLKGPSKRTDEDDRRFAESFTRLVEKRLKTENEA